MQPVHDQARTMRWMWYGLGAMFVLIGVAVLLAVVYNRTPMQVTSPTNFDFSWVWGLVGLFFVVWFFSRMFRWGGRMGMEEVQVQKMVRRRRVRYSQREICKGRVE